MPILDRIRSALREIEADLAGAWFRGLTPEDEAALERASAREWDHQMRRVAARKAEDQ
jgi:hypothetical protein